MDNWEGNGDSQCGDRGLDPFNSLLWYNPWAANALSALNQQLNVSVEGQGQGQKESWTQFVVEDKAEMKSDWMANSPVAQSVRSQEDQHSEICNVEEHVSEISGNKTSAEGDLADSKIMKKRKIKTEKGPRYAFKTRSETDVLEDGYKWRKYGRKIVKSSPHPRSYYRCSESNCSVKKRVERDPTDQGLLITTYEGTHNHESPSVIYYIGKPIILPQQGSKPAIVLVNASLCPEPVIKYKSHQAL